MPKKAKNKSPRNPPKKAQSIRDCLAPLADGAVISSLIALELSMSNPKDKELSNKIAQIMELATITVEKCNNIVANTQN